MISYACIACMSPSTNKLGESDVEAPYPGQQAREGILIKPNETLLICANSWNLLQKQKTLPSFLFI